MKTNPKKGFSLIELLIYTALFAAISIFTTGTFISVSKGAAKNTSSYEVVSNMRFALEKIRQDVKNSIAIISPVPDQSSSTLNLLVDTVQVAYSISGGVLQRQTIDPVSGSVLTTGNITSSDTNVTNITFRFFDNPAIPLGVDLAASINTDISAKYNSGSPDYSYSGELNQTALVEGRLSVERGYFGSYIGGGGNNHPTNCSNVYNNWWREIFLKKAYALLPPSGFPCVASVPPL